MLTRLGPEIFLALPALIIALTFHEYAHAYVSNWLGDPTPRMRGRLSLNPLVHIDPIGFLMLLIFQFGWAKPVEVSPQNYRNREKGYALVALAGPVMNLLLGLVSMLLYFASRNLNSQAISGLLEWLVRYNVILAVFNLLPIPPLDGSKLLFFFLPRNIVYRYLDTVQQYGTIVLILLVATGFVGTLISPLANGVIMFYQRIAGLLFTGTW